MSSEIRRSSLDNPGHEVTSDDENVIHSEQSIIESLPGPSSIQGIGNDEDDSTETSQNQDSQQPQSESSNTENIFFKGLKTIFGKETEDGSNTQVTFHVHLPSFDYIDGYPIIVGNIEELGNWEEPIVKLKQPSSSEYMFQSSYWYSDPISIPANKFDKVKYRYAFFQRKKNKDAKSTEEGDLYFEDGQQQRLLTTRTGSQFDIAARFRIKNRQCELRSIREFMFLDIIYDNITSNNLGEKITEYQELLNRFDQIKDVEIYSNIGMWLFYNCRSLDALLFVWIRVIDHTKSRDNQLIKHFLHRVEQLISSSHATGLTRQFSQIPTELHAEVAGIFRMQALTLLKHRGIEWNRSNSEEILNILNNSQLKWSEDNFLEAMYHVSESSKPNLLLIFPNLLEYWFKNFKPYFNPEICKNWYHHLIDINGSESSIANDPDFILEIYENLSYIFPIVGNHGEILEELLDVAANRVKNCAMSNILTVTPKIAKLRKEIYNSYGEM
ncbi:unnamed protein product [Rhizophagus irregularis]|nr:unnamed protein product [Rhizophagus irregularis]